MSGSSWSYAIDTLLYVALLCISMQCTPPSVTWMRAMTQGAPTWWLHQRDRLAAQRKRLLSSMCVCGLRASMMKGLCGALLPLPVVLWSNSLACLSLANSREPAGATSMGILCTITRWFFSFTLQRANPQPESAAVGSVTAIAPFSKKECGCSACFLAVWVEMRMSFALAANVGTKAQ